MVLAAPVSSAVLSTLSPTGAGTPRRGIPCILFEVLIMADKTKPVETGKASYYNPKLSASENETVNCRIKESWVNGRHTGAKSAYRFLYSRNRIKGGSS